MFVRQLCPFESFSFLARTCLLSQTASRAATHSKIFHRGYGFQWAQERNHSQPSQSDLHCVPQLQRRRTSTAHPPPRFETQVWRCGTLNLNNIKTSIATPIRAACEVGQPHQRGVEPQIPHGRVIVRTRWGGHDMADSTTISDLDVEAAVGKLRSD